MLKKDKVPGPDEKFIKTIIDREKYWSERWLKDKVFMVDRDPTKRKKFITFPYPYMNGSLHLGHAFSSGRLDVLARYYRLKGYNVLYPWAWHWTGEAVLGTVHRLIDGDETVRKRLMELDGVDEDTIKKFSDPVFFVKYFTERNRNVVKRYGLSIDWSREFHTTSLHPLYNKFIEWQIRKLFKKGFITKGRYPVVWCPRDKSPTGDHDRLKGEGVRPEEYTLIKFSLYMDGELYYLVAGTFRPETLYGVTNIWVNPNVEYVVSEVDSEKWIISNEAAFKLSHQLRRVKVLRKIKGSDLVGLYVKAPLTNKYVPILPASFVDPDMVTGIVYSVPAHAPYDYLALEDLRKQENLDPVIKEIAEWIKPISIIKVEGYGDYPAIEETRRMKISSQMDFEKADKATQEIYKKEYHKGIMKNNCGPISNLPVREAKEIIKSILFKENLASIMYDLPEEVICRCGTKTIVKILEDQWYLRYSDAKWKELAHKAVDKMDFYPPEVKKQFHYYIDWYEDWPCTRKTGLGTPFPFDKEWIVETLTDSTIYMAFYIIAKYYNMKLIDPLKIDDSFFDYVLLGEGDLDVVSEKTELPKNLLETLRNDFVYWYPVDIRGSGKDLVGNHLTFFIFHHAAIFPPDKWPKAISVNGYVMLNGKEMSKSKGNYISMEQAIKYIGADALRLSLLTLADGLEDPDWSLDKGIKAVERIRLIEDFIRKIYSMEDKDKISRFSYNEKLLITRFYTTLEEIESNIEKHRISYAGRVIAYRLFDIFKEYMRLSSNPNYTLLKKLLKEYVKLLSLYIPHTAEDLWHNVIKSDTYVSLEHWPKKNKKYVDPLLLNIHEYGEDLKNDILHVYRLISQQSPKNKIVIVISSRWKWDLVKEFVKKNSFNIKEFIKSVIERRYTQDKGKASSLAKLIQKEWFGRYAKYKKLINKWSQEDEFRFVKSVFRNYLLQDVKNIEIEVYREEEMPENIKIRKDPIPLYPVFIIT